MPMIRARTLTVVAIACLAAAPTSARAQSYFAPLVTPPASVGTCMPTRQARRGHDSVLVTERRLVMESTPPGSSREIQVATRRNGALAYSDMTHSTTTLTTSSGGDVVAFRDSLGHMRGWRVRSATVLPDSLIRPDTANLRHLREHIAAHTSSSRTPLSAAEEARVRAMAAWVLRRCPG